MTKKETVFIAICCLLSFFYIVLHPLCSLNCDTASYVVSAGFILDGKIPYYEIVDLNLPLIMYLHVLPEAIARIFGLHEGIIFCAFVILIVFLSLIISGNILSRLKGINRTFVRMILLITGIVSLQTLFPGTLGEREELFILLYLPYCCFRLQRYENQTIEPYTAWLLGFIAGVGVLLKPHFIPIALGPEIYLLIRYKQFKKLIAPEIIGVVTFSIAYCAHFLFVPESMRNSLFKIWMPLVAGHYYKIREPLWFIIYSNPIIPFSILVSIAGLLRAINSKKLWEKNILSILIIITLSAILMVLLQGKGLGYHSIPIDYCSNCILAMIFLSIYYKFRSIVQEGIPFYQGLMIVFKTKETMIALGAIILFVGQAFIFRYTKHDFVGTVIHVIRFYSVVPCLIVLFIIAVISVLQIKTKGIKQGVFSNTLFVSAITVFIVFCLLVVVNPTFASEKALLARPLVPFILSHSKPGDNVIAIENVPQPTIALLNRKYGTRFLWPIWPLAWGLEDQACSSNDKLPSVVKLYFNQLAQDIDGFHPVFIIINNSVKINGFTPFVWFCKVHFIENITQNYVSVEAPPGYNAFIRKENKE